jgi:hypothetical protein
MEGEMARQISERGAADVFASQVLALIALANALVETGVIPSDVLIASLERQMEKMRSQGAPANTALPIATLIRALRHEQGRRSSH